MSNEFIARKGLISLADSVVSGNLSVTGIIYGTASYSETASYAETSSYSVFTVTSSYSNSSSYSVSASSALTASVAITASFGVTASYVSLLAIGTSSLRSLQDMQNVVHSSGWVTGGLVTDNGNGTVSVTGGDGLLRAIDSNVAPLYFIKWNASASLQLTDNSPNWVVVKWNGGNTPLVSVQTTEPSNHHTLFTLAEVFRNGNILHINVGPRFSVGDHAALMMESLSETMPYSNANGGRITTPGGLDFAISVGTWWHGLTKLQSPLFDTSTGSRFSYFYTDGFSNWTEIQTSSQIDNTQYNDLGTGNLQPLSTGNYGVQWVYQDVSDGHVLIVYDDCNCVSLYDAQTHGEPMMDPSEMPPIVQYNARLMGRIIVKQGLSTIANIESAFVVAFRAGVDIEHNYTVGLQGGQSGQYYHINLAQSASVANLGTISSQNANNVNLTGSFNGNLTGTASWASTAQTASYARTASYVVSAQTASYSVLAQTASYASLAQTASYAALAQTASYSSLAQTASYAALAQTASYVITSSYAAFALTASYALTTNAGQYAITGSNNFFGNQVISGNLSISSSWDGVTISTTGGQKVVAGDDVGYNNYAGVDDMPSITDIGGGTMSFDGNGSCRLYGTDNCQGRIVHAYMPAQQVSLPIGVISYINVHRVSDRVAQYVVTTDPDDRNGSDKVLFLTCYYHPGVGAIEYFARNSMGRGMPNKHMLRQLSTQDVERETGLSLSVSGSSNVVEITGGKVWIGIDRKVFPAVKSDVGIGALLNGYHSASVWKSSLTTTMSNALYDDGANLQPLPLDGYNVGWVYKYVADTATGSAVYILGSQSGSVAEAIAAGSPTPPDSIAKLAVLVGKVIFQSGSNTPYSVESSFTNVFEGTTITRHGDLSGLTNDDHPQYLLLTGTRPIRQYVLGDVDFGGITEIDKLIIGTGSIVLPNTPLHIGGDVDSYFQIDIQNTSSGVFASTDWILGNDKETDTSHYLDLGINSSNFNNPNYDWGKANNSYLMAQTSSLIIGITDPEATDGIIFHVGGTSSVGHLVKLTPDRRMTLNKSGSGANGTLDISGSVVITGSIRITSGITGSITTASYARFSETSSLAQTSSYSALSQTASYVISASYSISSSYSVSASYSITSLSSSFSRNSDTASISATSVTASYVATASFVTTAATSSYVLYSNVVNKPPLVSSSAQISYLSITNIPTDIVSSSAQVVSFISGQAISPLNITSSLNGTSSWALLAITASSALQAVTASYVTQSGYLFSVSTSSQVIAVANTYQDVRFDTNYDIAGWVHPVPSGQFTASVSAIYNLEAVINLTKTAGSSQTAAIRFRLNGTEIAGSYSAVTVVTNNLTQDLRSQTTVFIASGSAIKAEWAATTVNFSAAVPTLIGASISRPTAKILIRKV